MISRRLLLILSPSTGGATTLALTSFSTDDSFPSGENSAIVGTNLDQVTTATLDGLNVYSGFSDSSATAATQQTPTLTDAQQSNFPHYGNDLAYVVGDGVDTDSLTLTHTAPSGKQYVTLAGALNTDPTESLIPHESGFTIVAGDQLIVDSTATGGASPAIDISAANGTFSFSYSEGTTYTVDFQFLDVSTNTLYAAGTATVRDGVIVLGSSSSISISIGIGI